MQKRNYWLNKSLYGAILLILLIGCNSKDDDEETNNNTTKPQLPIDVAFVDIPAGTFIMGSALTEMGRWSDEGPQHIVTLSAFKMSKYEITNAQYAQFLNDKEIGSDGKYSKGAYPDEPLIYPSIGNDDWGLHFEGGRWIPVSGFDFYPVIKVTFYGAMEFATYMGCLLPTEAQWEYAARAGTTTPFNTGECIQYYQANYSWTSSYGNCGNAISYDSPGTQAVGSFSANPWGVYDMHGNVWEWCSDWYWDDYYAHSPQTNPTGPLSGSYRVNRGGSWLHDLPDCRAANRSRNNPDRCNSHLGIRLVLIP